MRVHTLAPADDTPTPSGYYEVEVRNIYKVLGSTLPECVINMLFLVLFQRDFKRLDGLGLVH